MHRPSGQQQQQTKGLKGGTSAPAPLLIMPTLVCVQNSALTACAHRLQHTATSAVDVAWDNKLGGGVRDERSINNLGGVVVFSCEDVTAVAQPISPADMQQAGTAHITRLAYVT
jgi:hypothetical protein